MLAISSSEMIFHISMFSSFMYEIIKEVGLNSVKKYITNIIHALKGMESPLKPTNARLLSSLSELKAFPPKKEDMQVLLYSIAFRIWC